MIADTNDGYVFCMQTDLADEAAKDRFAEIARLLAVALGRPGAHPVVEAWVRFANAAGDLGRSFLELTMPARTDPIIIIFSKKQVRHCKLAHFLQRFGPNALPAGPELAALMGRFQFLVHGYEADPAELHCIPGVQKSTSASTASGPTGSSSATCGRRHCHDDLCLMPDLKGYKRIGDPMDLVRFVQQNFKPLKAMMDCAGMSARTIYQRTKDICVHFHLPFDAEPPDG